MSKELNILRTSADKQAKDLRKTISAICSECGMGAERYLSPCKACPYRRLHVDLCAFRNTRSEMTGNKSSL